MSSKRKRREETIPVEVVDAAVERTQEILAIVKAEKVRKPWPKEAREALSEKLRSYYMMNPERKEQIRRSIIAHWDQEKRAQHSQKMKAILSQPEVRAKITSGLRKFWSDFKAVRKEMEQIS
jgi:GTPase involved in cell partitioning and DNA repair